MFEIWHLFLKKFCKISIWIFQAIETLKRISFQYLSSCSPAFTMRMFAYTNLWKRTTDTQCLSVLNFYRWRKLWKHDRFFFIQKQILRISQILSTNIFNVSTCIIVWFKLRFINLYLPHISQVYQLYLFIFVAI